MAKEIEPHLDDSASESTMSFPLLDPYEPGQDDPDLITEEDEDEIAEDQAEIERWDAFQKED
jgi:hypothetical protein